MFHASRVSPTHSTLLLLLLLLRPRSQPGAASFPHVNQSCQSMSNHFHVHVYMSYATIYFSERNDYMPYELTGRDLCYSSDKLSFLLISENYPITQL